MPKTTVTRIPSIQVTFPPEYKNELKEFEQLSKNSGIGSAALARLAIFKMLRAVKNGEAFSLKND